MNQYYRVATCALVAVALNACSSMEIDSAADRQGDMLPSDFAVAEFAALNPDVACSQVISNVFGQNIIYLDSLKSAGVSPDEVSAFKKQQDSLFQTDVATLEVIYERCLNQSWVGFDSLLKAEVSSLLRFNGYGTDGDLAYMNDYLENRIDSALIVKNYVVYGIPEGRAYRACTAEDPKTTEKSVGLPGVLDTKTSSVNYSGYRFCSQVQTDGLPTYYVIQ